MNSKKQIKIGTIIEVAGGIEGKELRVIEIRKETLLCLDSMGEYVEVHKSRAVVIW